MECPNCHQLVSDGRPICPNCGADVSSAWPPPPLGDPPLGSQPKGEKTSQQANGFGVGCLLAGILYFFLLPFAFMVGVTRRFPRGYPGFHAPLVFRYGTWPVNLVPLVLVGLLYFALRPKYPRFARGLGYCLLAIAVLLLWGLAACRQ